MPARMEKKVYAGASVVGLVLRELLLNLAPSILVVTSIPAIARTGSGSVPMHPADDPSGDPTRSHRLLEHLRPSQQNVSLDEFRMQERVGESEVFYPPSHQLRAAVVALRCEDWTVPSRRRVNLDVDDTRDSGTARTPPPHQRSSI